MDWHTSHSNDVQILELDGRFDAHGAQTVKRWLAKAAAQPQPNIIVRLGGVTFIDSQALRTLAVGHKLCSATGGQLLLAELTQVVRITLELTQLDGVFTIAESVNSALDLFNRAANGQTRPQRQKPAKDDLVANVTAMGKFPRFLRGRPGRPAPSIPAPRQVALR